MNNPIQNSTIALKEATAMNPRPMSYAESIETVDRLSKALTMRGLLARIGTVCDLRAESYVSANERDSAELWSNLATKLTKLSKQIDS
jgi:hypothetical protein